MKSKILVNKVEIEKFEVQSFLLQNRKLEAVKYICDNAHIGLMISKEIVELFQANKIDEYDGKDLYKTLKGPVPFSSETKVPLLKKRTKKVIIILGVICFSIFLFLKYVIGFQHIGHHLESISNWNYMPSSNEDDVDVITEMAAGGIQTPCDTLIWANALKNGEYIPDDVKESIKECKTRDFSSLIPATEMPTDLQAQEAIVHRYKNEIISLLQQYKAHIKIGVGFKGVLQVHSSGDMEIARVTAMVSAFNDERGNLGNISMPLDVIYDFVKYKSDPNRWYITDFSQTIPYDHVLNKDPW